ncbi:teichoic acid transporter [Halogeometricum borinquense]|uniref:Teichoic acid transporter n=1 Tax=Halogeometricum borinquense TaxID=60847 RepID=A0A482T902_9EURY|nr:teichoic acid transporter [Halogeometricum borinquense]RYJ08409.1 teichoic acid transporter [Halogeometricum borinquense]
MRLTHRLRTTGIVLIALTIALVAYSGGVAAQTTDGGQVGICVIGVDSPCNGDQWDGSGWSDGNNLPSHDAPSSDVEIPGGNIGFLLG